MAVIWHTTLPAEFQEDNQEAPEGEYMAASNKRKDSPRSPVTENGTATGGKTTPESNNDGETTGMNTRPAPAKSRKRKAAEETATDASAPKRAKKRSTKAENAESAEVPALKKTRKRAINAEDAEPGESPAPKRRKAGKGRTNAESIDMPPPPLPPAQVSKPVANKIVQLHNYINTHPELKLDRDSNSDGNQDLLTIPELDLTGILSIMYWHYEIGTQPETPLSDVEDAIVNRSQQELGTDKVLADVVTIDVAKMTKLEDTIHEKIVRHGLDDMNLLKVEIEIYKERASEMVGLWRPAVDRLLTAVADEAGGEAKADAEGAAGDEAETRNEAETKAQKESEATSPGQMIREGSRRPSVCQLPLME